MTTPPCAIPPRPRPRAPSSSACSPPPAAGAAGHSYSASLPPTYRLSAFPVSPTACAGPLECDFHIASTSTLPPGLGLARRGCASDHEDDDHDQEEESALSPSRGGPIHRRRHSPARPTHIVRGFDCLATVTTASVHTAALTSASASSSSGSGSHCSAESQRSASASSRDSSARSSLSSSAEGDGTDESASSSSALGGGATTTPLSSLAGSLVSLAGASAAAEGDLPKKLEWSMQGLVVAPVVPRDDAAKREREARARRGGWEDPALAAARRALWDDVDDSAAPVASTSGSSPPRAGAPGRDVQGDLSAGTQSREEEREPDGRLTDDDDVDRGVGDGDDGEDEEDDEGEAEEGGIPSVRRPCHATLAPRSSCLRYSPAARASLSLPAPTACTSPTTAADASADDPLSWSGRHSPSAGSFTTTISTSDAAPSVSFSCAPPQTCPTWSAEVYSRRGDAPVEKLSIREWVELQGVREAVGVWSGKIAKWDEAAAVEAAGGGTGGGGDSPGTPNKTRPAPGGLAAVVGVVHISRSTPTSPVDPTRNLS